MRAASGVRVPSLRGRVSGRGPPVPGDSLGLRARDPARVLGLRGSRLRPAVRAALGGDAAFREPGGDGARAAPPLARPGPGARAAPGGSGRGARAAGAPGTRALAPPLPRPRTRPAAPPPPSRPPPRSRPARARPPGKGRRREPRGLEAPATTRLAPVSPSARLPAQPSAWGPWVSRPGRPAPTATAGRLVAVAEEKGWAVCGKWV